MNRFYNFSISFLLLFSLFIVNINNVQAQQKSSDCVALPKLEANLESLRKAMNPISDKTKKTIPSLIKKCDIELNNVRKQCPMVDYGPNEEDLNKLKKQWEKFSNLAKGKVYAGELILKGYWQIQPVAAIQSIAPNTLIRKADAQLFYNKAKRIDFINLKNEIEGLIQQYPNLLDNAGFKHNYDEVIVEFPKKFDSLVKNYLQVEIRTGIENAYNYDLKYEFADAIEAAEAAQILCQAILLVIPDQKEASELIIDAEAILNNTGGEGGKVIYTTLFHKNNQNKIFFSDKIIQIKKENPFDFKDRFRADEFIYGMIYLKSSFNNLVPEQFTCILALYADSVEIANHYFQIPGEQREWSYFPLEIIVNSYESQTNYIPKFVQALASLSPDVHNI
ncbi:MAG: hypothetical protein WCT77_05625, partial [Bacteroidota bacterium]